MAKQASKSPGTPSRGRGGQRSRNGRRASQKTDQYRFAQNVDGEPTMAEREYLRYATEGGADMGEEPDVLLTVPVVKVDSIHLELDNLDAHVALKAQVLDLVELNLGVDVHLGEVRLDIKGVEAQALLKVRLDHVAAVVDRVLTTLDRNPELLDSIGQAVEDVGAGAGHALSETGEAVDEVGEGAGQAVGEIGEGAGQAAGEIGEGAGQAAGDLGKGTGEAVGQVGETAGQAVGNLGQGAGAAVGGIGEAAGGLGQAAGQAGEAAGGAAEDQGAGSGQAGAGQLARAAAKTMAKELGSAATDEAKELGMAAARKAKDLGERRRQHRAEKHNATEAAMAAAMDLDVDLATVDGTGAGGRITVKDVRQAGSE
jgi:e3 binding domain